MGYELTHDTIAKQVFQKASTEAQTRRKIEKYIQERYKAHQDREARLTQDDLDYISPYLAQVNITNAQAEFVEKERTALRLARRKRQLLIVSVIIILLVFSIISGLLFFRANRATIAMGKAQKETIAALYKAERNSRANQNALRALKLLDTDPTQALALAEMNHRIFPESESAAGIFSKVLKDEQARYKKIIQKGNAQDILAVAFDSTGQFILTGGDHGLAILWDIKGNPKQTFRGHSSAITDLTFSPDGQSILTGSQDSTAILWTLKGDTIRTFKEHQKAILAVAFSPDGKSILTGSQDKTAILQSLEGKLIKTFLHEDQVTDVVFSPNGQFIYTVSGEGTTSKVQRWSLNGKPLKPPINISHAQDHPAKVALSPDGKSILTHGHFSTDVAQLYDLEGEEKAKFYHKFDGTNYYVSAFAFSPDGQSILTGGYYLSLKKIMSNT